MEDKKEKQMHLKMENVAVPEVKVHGYEDDETVEEVKGKDTDIDYSGAVPTVRVRKN